MNKDKQVFDKAGDGGKGQGSSPKTNKTPLIIGGLILLAIIAVTILLT